jgi:putative heme transporter
MAPDGTRAASQAPGLADEALQQPMRPWRRALRFALGLTLGSAAVWIVVRAGGGLGDAWQAIGRVNAWWLIPALVSEGLAYVFAGLRLRRLAGAHTDFTVASATGVELVVNGLGLLAPAAPAEGLAFEVSELSRRGLDRRRIALTLGFEQWFSLRVFLLVNALNLGWILASRDLPVDSTWPLIAAPLILVALLATAVLANRPATAETLAVAAGALRFWKPRAAVPDRRVAGANVHADAKAMLGPARKRVVLPLLSVASMLANVSCLYFVLIAAHAHVGFDIAILAAGAAATAGLIPLLPGGLGVVEVIIPTVVHWYGPPFDAALAAALVYRVLGTFLPAAAGAAALLALRTSRQ